MEDSGIPTYFSSVLRRRRLLSPFLSLVAEILKIQSHREVVCAHGRDHRLQVVPTLSSHTNLVAENLCCDLRFGIADEACDFFGDGSFDALFNLDRLPRVAER